MKRQFAKGDLVMIWENGEPTQMSTNLDQDRELSVGDIFGWQPRENREPIQMKVLSIEFPLSVEELL
jgi:hypothetical protein